MTYSYYPGCSLHSAHKGYDTSCRAVFRALGCELVELPDWNCCGATIYMSIKQNTSLAIAARNLAIAEREGKDLVTPCSSCYTVLLKAHKSLKYNQQIHDGINGCLAEAGLHYDGTVRVRHPLDVLLNDIGMEVVERKTRRSLEGLRIASYYGCQIVRPDKGFDDTEDPRSLENLFESIGAENVYYPCKLRCCGGMLMTTAEEIALGLTRDLLETAVENRAECIATTCPLCQMNLEAYQRTINRRFNTDFDVPILFFTQILGVALGCSARELGIGGNLTRCARLEDIARRPMAEEAHV